MDVIKRLSGRVAIVTGAGQGVGEGIARRLASEGATVVVAARRAVTGEPVAQSIVDSGGVAECIETDVSFSSSIDACVHETVRRFGHLDVMVHNAFSGAVPHRLDELDLERHWARMSRTGTWASVACARSTHVHLRASTREGRGGRLILVTSPSGIEGSANIPLYSAVKASQRAIAKSLAREWGADGITVNCVAPVASSPALMVAFENNPELKSAIERRTPLSRIGDVTNDIGPVVSFLASSDSSYVTGQTIVCDGGSFLGL